VPWTLANSTINENRAQDGGGLYHIGDTSFACLNTSIANNSAFHGGGAYMAVATSRGWVTPFVLLGNGTITNNYAAGGGGGLY
jgi:hypothetical protein